MKQQRIFRKPRSFFIFRFIFTTVIFLLSGPKVSGQAFAKSSLESPSELFIPVVMKGDPAAVASSTDWLQYLNTYRTMANLPPVTENHHWSIGSINHARYIVKNDVLGHSEDKGNKWYTPEGDAAARSSNIMASSNADKSDYHAIDSWMQAPFHALAILDPALDKVGFGSYREADGGLQMSAALDVLRGLDHVPDQVKFPITWPGNGTSVSLNHYWGEYPNPLASCPNYTAPSGLPIILQVGSGDLTPVVEAYSFKTWGQMLESCVFSETSYVNSDDQSQSLARAILNERDAIVLIPRYPLSYGNTYTVSITVSGKDYIWSFEVSEAGN